MKYAPVLFGLVALLVWEAAVRISGVPSYLVPGPVAIIAAFLADPSGLLISLASTLLVTFAALLMAAVLGVTLAVGIASSRLLAAAIATPGRAVLARRVGAAVDRALLGETARSLEKQLGAFAAAQPAHRCGDT